MPRKKDEIPYEGGPQEPEIEPWKGKIDFQEGQPRGYRSVATTYVFPERVDADPEELKTAIKRFCAVKPSERVAAACLKHGVEPFEVLAAAANNLALDPEIRLRAAEGLAKRLDPLEGANAGGQGTLNVTINIDKAEIASIRREMGMEENE